jgi:hypothetical protein
MVGVRFCIHGSLVVRGWSLTSCIDRLMNLFGDDSIYFESLYPYCRA